MVEYRKGEQLEREDDLARLFDLVLLCGHVVTTVTVTTFVEFRERKLILSRANANTRREKVYCSQGERSVFPIVFLYLNSYLPIPQRLRVYTQSETYFRNSFLTLNGRECKGSEATRHVARWPRPTYIDPFDLRTSN